jgi:hypothetical protein
MKKIITLLLFTVCTAAYAQPKLLTQAIITTKTTIVSSEGDEAPMQTNTSADGGEVRVMRFGGDGETKTTTWLKNNLVKTFSESEMGRSTVIRDNVKKITTTIMEMMGRKNGFYATDEDQAEMRKRMDSMMKGRNQNISSLGGAGATANYTLVIATRGEKADTTTVWYSPDFKLQNIASTGGIAAGFGGFSAAGGPTGFDLLNGFPLQYERNMSRGRHMTVEVTKLLIDKEITDKEFEISKDIEIKSAKEMQNGFGPGGGPMIQMRVGG